jgi:hypothetical protein
LPGGSRGLGDVYKRQLQTALDNEKALVREIIMTITK